VPVECSEVGRADHTLPLAISEIGRIPQKYASPRVNGGQINVIDVRIKDEFNESLRRISAANRR